jgi:pimeloyl-ACP methyl ester carboxylesterase
MISLFRKPYGHSGEPVIILHGLFGMLDNWHLIAQRLSDAYRVVSVDLRNHGHSPHSDEMSYELMATDVANLIADLGFSSANVMGHSMGGKVAMTLAKSHSELIRKLMVVDIAPKSYEPSHAIYFRALKLLKAETINSRSQAESLIIPLVPVVAIRQFLLKNLYRSQSGEYLLRMNVDAIEGHYTEISGGITFDKPFVKPTLFIKGSDSNYISSADEIEIKKMFTNCRITTISNAGHWVHADQPDSFLRATRQFLAE